MLNNQRGAVNIAIVLLVALFGMVATGGGVWYVKDQELKNQKRESNRQLAQLQSLLRDSSKPTPSPSPVTQGQLSGGPTSVAAAQKVVQQFILGVANPGKPVTPDQRKLAMKYLTPRLQSDVNQKYAGDPSALLGLPSPAPFEVPLPNTNEDKADVTVTFQTTPTPKTVKFNLVIENGTWLIDSVTPGSS